MKQKLCKNCSTEITPTGSAQLYCPSCADIVRRESARLRAKIYRAAKGKKVGVGKGGANSSFTEDSQYKNGRGFFQKNRNRIRLERRYCSKCSKDLLDASRYMWVIHHIDHNRLNNDPSNWALLCKRCHQIEHNCHRAFEGVTTREQSRRALE